MFKLNKKNIFLNFIILILFSCGHSERKISTQINNIVNSYLTDIRLKREIDTTSEILILNYSPFNFELLKHAKYTLHLYLIDKKHLYNHDANQIFSHQGLEIVVNNLSDIKIKFDRIFQQSSSKYKKTEGFIFDGNRNRCSIFFDSKFEVIALYSENNEELKKQLESNRVLFSKNFIIDPWSNR